MIARETIFTFRSPLACWMAKFIQEKRILGWRYETEYKVLCRLDRHLCEIKLDSEQLPREVVECWAAAAPHEKPESQAVRLRTVRQFTKYLARHGVPAYSPPERSRRSPCRNHTPYIFTHGQVAVLLATVDRLEAEGRAGAPSHRSHFVVLCAFVRRPSDRSTSAAPIRAAIAA